MKCKHEWRFLRNTYDGERYYCIHCLASATKQWNIREGNKVTVENYKHGGGEK